MSSLDILNFLSLDLEMNQPSRKIIQVGAVAGDIRSGLIYERLRIYVKIDEPLNPMITDLTGIQEAHLEGLGVTLSEAYGQLVTMHTRHKCETNPLTWGGGDSAELREQLGFDENHFIFGRRWFDVKTVFQSYQMARGKCRQSGLAKSMTKLGLNFQGRKHDAQDDAENTFKTMHLLLYKFRD